jgi:two-component system OmpR family response regulator
VVIFSNYATEEVRRRALDLGADAVFDKSTEVDGLLDFLERLSPSALQKS